MNNLFVFLLAGLCLCTSACSIKEEADEVKGNNEPKVLGSDIQDPERDALGIILKKRRTTELEPDLMNQRAYLDGLNRFEVSLQVPKTLGPVTFTASTLTDPNKFMVIPGTSSDNYFEARYLVNLSEETLNQEYKIQLKLNFTDGKVVTKSVSLFRDIAITSDVSFEKSGLIPGKNQIGRLFITENAKLYTQDKSFLIQAKELVALPGSAIQTFPESIPPAEAGKSGMSGGIVQIQTDEAVGTLIVTMRGQDGGVGLEGKSNNVPAAKGAPGNPGNVRCLWGEPDDVWHFTRMLHCQCILKSGDGQPGTDGQLGEPGMRGGNGGNSGTFHLKAFKDNGFAAVRTVIPGRPGLGGLGGLNGLGGPGGDPGLYTVNHEGCNGLGCKSTYEDISGNDKFRTKEGAVLGMICPKANAGATGRAFPGRAMVGPAGEYGAAGTACVEFGLNSTPQCTGAPR